MFSKILRKAFIYQKAYLLKSGMQRECYSQFGEDIAINRFFSNQEVGFFVDVGCFHPLFYSNTWKLYKKGWRGVNIDIDAVKIEVFDVRRPEDINISCAVSNQSGVIDYYQDGDYSLTTTIDKSFSEARGGYEKKSVISRTLTSILDDTEYKSCCIDFLSIDAEGNDLNVLKSLDFDRYMPRLIAIETEESILSNVQKSDVYLFLLDKDYMMIAWNGLSLIMSKELPHYTR